MIHLISNIMDLGLGIWDFGIAVSTAYPSPKPIVRVSPFDLPITNNMLFGLPNSR